MMNLSQTKLVGLTMELDLKAREYKKLCDKLDELKEEKIDPNDERLLAVKELFQKNHDDIVEINSQIKEIKENKKNEQYNRENIFNEKKYNSEIKNEESINMSVVQTKNNIFVRVIKKLKQFFKL